MLWAFTGRLRMLRVLPRTLGKATILAKPKKAKAFQMPLQRCSRPSQRRKIPSQRLLKPRYLRHQPLNYRNAIQLHRGKVLLRIMAKRLERDRR